MNNTHIETLESRTLFTAATVSFYVAPAIAVAPVTVTAGDTIVPSLDHVKINGELKVGELLGGDPIAVKTASGKLDRTPTGLSAKVVSGPGPEGDVTAKLVTEAGSTKLYVIIHKGAVLRDGDTVEVRISGDGAEPVIVQFEFHGVSKIH